MRLLLHTIICCCLFTMVLPLVRGAKEELNSSLKKRFKVWLQSRMKRDVHSSLVPSKDQYDDIHDEPQDENTKIPSPPTCIEQIIRFRRSASSSKQTGCLLGTCAYHVLLHDLYNINKQKEATAPKEKIGSKGYGRRRRSLLEAVQLVLQTRTRRRSTEAGQQVHRHKRTCSEA